MSATSITLPEKTLSVPKPFIEGTNFQFAWDSTSLGYLKECPRKYYYSMILGVQGKNNSVHLIFGLVFHAALERFDWSLASGAEYEDAVDAAVAYTLEATWDQETGTPWTSDHKNKNRETLLRSVVWYLEHYRDDPVKTIILSDGRPAVELSFKFELPFDVGGHSLLYCGHMDRLVDYAGSPFVMDRKTTSTTPGPYYFSSYSPDNQMSGYTLAGQIVYDIPVSGVIIDAAQIAVGFSSFSRGFTMRSRGQLEEWLRDSELYIRRANEFADADYWPMNDKACHNYGGCPFRIVCSQDPSVRENYIETNFEKRLWNPLESR